TSTLDSRPGADRVPTLADRCTPRIDRPADLEDALPRPDARLGDQPADPAGVQRRAGAEPGLALPSAPAAGEGRSGQELLGRDGEQPPGALLRDHPGRPTRAGGGNRELAAVRGGAGDGLAQRLIHAGERAGRREPGAPSPHAARERRRRSHSLDAGAAARAAHSTTPGRPSMAPRQAAHARRTPSLDRSTIHELAPRPPNPPEPP